METMTETQTDMQAESEEAQASGAIIAGGVALELEQLHEKSPVVRVRCLHAWFVFPSWFRSARNVRFMTYGDSEKLIQMISFRDSVP